MNNTRFHYYVMYGCLALGVFMYLDTYIFPLKTGQAVITKLEVSQYKGRYSHSYSYFMYTAGGKSSITELLFGDVNVKDTIYPQRSFLSHTLQKVTIKNQDKAAVYTVGFLSVRMGNIIVPLLMAGTLILLYYYKRIDNLQGKANLTYALLTAMLLTFLCYLDINFF
jgi:hypothetical protein